MSKSKNIKLTQIFNKKVLDLGLGYVDGLLGFDPGSLTNPGKEISFNDIADVIYSDSGEFVGGQAAVIAHLCEIGK
tara:strand:- start:377 stop:604 length:228 start_codon:yes stop_codon:yes gene_type:complete